MSLHDGSVWARFEIPKELVSFRSKTLKRNLTAKQKKAISVRLHTEVSPALAAEFDTQRI
jgi:hypothetical protein